MEEDGQWFLSIIARFRSNDAYKAAFMNIFALVQLQKTMAERISRIWGKSIYVL
jgi:thymidylate synthase